MVDAKIGKPILRVEDERLLSGKGRFSDDLNLPGQAYACIVRSPHAHARNRGIDVAADEVIAKGARIAAVLLEAAIEDIEFTDGRFTIRGTDRALGIFEVAAAAVERGDLPGIKAGGEGGTTPAPGVVINAVVDALAALGVRDVTMPATPYRLWQAINARR